MENTPNNSASFNQNPQNRGTKAYEVVLGTIYVIAITIVAIMVVDRLPESIRPDLDIAKAAYGFAIVIIPVTFLLYLIYRSFKKRELPIAKDQQTTGISQDLEQTLSRPKNQMLVISSVAWGLGFPCVLMLTSAISITVTALLGQALKSQFDVWSVAGGIIPYIIVVILLLANGVVSVLIIKKILAYFKKDSKASL